MRRQDGGVNSGMYLMSPKGHLPPPRLAAKAAIERPECGRHRTTAFIPYTSICSDISSASSISMPRYLTVLSSFVWPKSSCTARRFLVCR